MVLKKEGLWVALDGIDAVGKSTQLPRVAQGLRDQGVELVAEIKEFSSSLVGQTITGILKEKRFYALNDERNSPMADTLHLLSDKVYSYETVIAPVIQQQGVAISDRGISSFVGHQAVRICEHSSEFNEKDTISWAETLAKHCLAIPDLTILIRISHEELMRRVVGRGEKQLSTDELGFLEKVDRIMLQTIKRLSKDYLIINGEQRIEDLTAQIVAAITQKLN